MARYMISNVNLNGFSDRIRSEVEDFDFSDDVEKLISDTVDACSDYPNDVTIIWDTELHLPCAIMSYDEHTREVVVHYPGSERCERRQLSQWLLEAMER